MPINEEILEKLKKVLNLAHRGATPGEAEAAFQRAMDIARKYNIDLASVDVSETKKNIKAERDDLKIRSKYKQPYHDWVLHTLRECFEVRTCCFIDKTPNGVIISSIALIGDPMDVAMCKAIFPWLEALFPRVLSRFVREKVLTYKAEDMNACYRGIAAGLIKANKRELEKLSTDDQNKFAMVVRSKREAIDSLFEQLFPDAETPKARKRQFSPLANHLGYEEGLKHNLRQTGNGRTAGALEG